MTSLNCAGVTLALLVTAVSCGGGDNATQAQNAAGGTTGSGGATGTKTKTEASGGSSQYSVQATAPKGGGSSTESSTAASGGAVATGGASTATGTASLGGGSSTQATKSAGGATSTSGPKASGGASGKGSSPIPQAGASVVAGAPSTGATAAAGSPTNATGGTASGGGTQSVGGETSATGGVAGSQSSVAIECNSAGAVITYPTLPGATESPLYTVTANGATQFVEKLTKFSPEMQVHYANFSVARGCTASIAVTVKESFSAYTLSPKSRKLSATKSGNTLTFSSGPNYLVLKLDSKDLLFILIDEQEAAPPKIGDPNVKNLADYKIDNTGATLETSKIQSAIDAASGAAQNVLYIPPGRYKTGEISLKSDMTLYLAAGAILDGSTKTSDYAAAGPAVENTTHGVLHLNNVTNANILGRGVIDGNGSVIRGTNNDTPSFKINVLRIDQSSKIVVDGILVRDSVFWNTLIYNSDQVTFRNYKVINRRPTTTTYNQTDGVDFDCSTNGTMTNGFIYSGDDSMSPKREQEGKLDTSNILYEKVVAYSNSATTKIGTKTFGSVMQSIKFKDLDIVKAGRAMAIDANDTAAIRDIKWEDIRIEAADSNLIDIECDRAPDWRTAPNTATVKDAYFTNIACDVKQLINIHGLSSSVNVAGVHFSSFTVQGKAITSQTDSDASWNINQYVSNITFE